MNKISCLGGTLNAYRPPPTTAHRSSGVRVASHGNWCLVVLLAALGMASPQVLADSDVGEGTALAAAVYERPDGFDMALKGHMRLTKSRSERSRTFYSYRLTKDNDRDVALIRFSDPANIAGTGLLVDPNVDGVWLYLPALKRVRRISSHNKGGRFANSQLYYEDLQDRGLEEDTHTIIGQGDYEGIATTLLESTPTDPGNSAYTKRISWIHPDLLLPLRIDFFAGNNEPTKRLEVLQVDDIQGYWTVTDSRMTDLSNGDSTQVTIEAIQYDQGLPITFFTTNSLASLNDEIDFRP